MKKMMVKSAWLAALSALALAGCAEAPQQAADGAPLVVASAGNCKAQEAQTGTSIVRKDCSGNANVKSIDAEAFRGANRGTAPDPKH